MITKFTVCENFSLSEDIESGKLPKSHDGRRAWVESCGWHLHSDGRVYLRAPEFFRERKDAEALLAKYPDPQIPKPKLGRAWRSGDVFQYPQDDETRRMIYISGINRQAPAIFCLDELGCDMGHVGLKVDDYLLDAKFLFNLNDRMGQAQTGAAKPKCITCRWHT